MNSSRGNEERMKKRMSIVQALGLVFWRVTRGHERGELGVVG